jgi:hypothetical protein
MNSSQSSSSPPIINISKPSTTGPKLPGKRSLLNAIHTLWHVRNLRYACLWITFGVGFVMFGKTALARREEDLLIEDLNQLMRNKKMKNNE